MDLLSFTFRQLPFRCFVFCVCVCVCIYIYIWHIWRLLHVLTAPAWAHKRYQCHNDGLCAEISKARLLPANGAVLLLISADVDDSNFSNCTSILCPPPVPHHFRNGNFRPPGFFFTSLRRDNALKVLHDALRVLLHVKFTFVWFQAHVCAMK